MYQKGFWAPWPAAVGTASRFTPVALFDIFSRALVIASLEFPIVLTSMLNTRAPSLGHVNLRWIWESSTPLLQDGTGSAVHLTL